MMIPESKYDPMIPSPYYIARIEQETSDTFTMEFSAVHEHSMPPFKAGQFNMLYIFGVGEVPISISGDPNIPQKIIHTTRAVGTVTNVMKTLKKGMAIGIRGPYGSHWPVEKALGKDVVLVAGGIGLAPLRPTLYDILARREKFAKVTLLYGARTPDDILYKQELKDWHNDFDIDVHLTVDHAIGNWHGHVGVVTKLIPQASFDPGNTIAMLCGPEVMMRYSNIALETQGIPPSRIYLSMERNMKCAIGLCGHCQYGAAFICKDGPVFRLEQIEHLFLKREI